jgi:GT2 family glycosyltransferase
VSAAEPVSVIVPTVGRPVLLAQLLGSLRSCRPAPAEVVVVDQSPDRSAQAVAEAQPDLPVRVVPCEGRGIGRALNVGLRSARHPIVMVTNDDCTVAEDWVAVGSRLAGRWPDALHSGRVLAPSDAAHVPSTKTSTIPHEFAAGAPVMGALAGGNAVLPRDDVLALGGFDERPGLAVAAEDNDLCYRWLASGRPVRFDPDLVVWHHDWRSEAQLAQRYLEYARGNGAMYAKHLAAGDRRVLPMLVTELAYGLRAQAAAWVRRTPRHADWRLSILRGLPPGFIAGWRAERRPRRG